MLTALRFPDEVPFNLLRFRDIMNMRGLSHKEKEFFQNSGQLCGLCYREDIEMYLRTSHIAGFHLLSLADTHVSGTSLTGMLNVFNKTKNIMTPEQWRCFCSDRVALIRMDRFTYRSGEQLKGCLQFANYGSGAIYGAVPYWSLSDGACVLIQGKLDAVDIPQGGLYDLGEVELSLSCTAPCVYTLQVGIENGPANSYPIWVYPEERELTIPDEIKVALEWEEASAALAKGEKVLYFPANLPLSKALNGEFASNFWSYTMFRKISLERGNAVPAGTMGISCDPNHPSLSLFPNRGYSEWQWYPIVTNGAFAVLDNFPKEFEPIIWGIDNPMRGSKLGLLFEMKVGPGSLLVCMSRLPDMQDSPPTAWMYRSIIAYMASKDFSPAVTIDDGFLSNFFTSNK